MYYKGLIGDIDEACISTTSLIPRLLFCTHSMKSDLNATMHAGDCDLLYYLCSWQPGMWL